MLILFISLSPPVEVSPLAHWVTAIKSEIYIHIFKIWKLSYERNVELSFLSLSLSSGILLESLSSHYLYWQTKHRSIGASSGEMLCLLETHVGSVRPCGLKCCWCSQMLIGRLLGYRRFSCELWASVGQWPSLGVDIKPDKQIEWKKLNSRIHPPRLDNLFYFSLQSLCYFLNLVKSGCV